jgi:hypothetical protein
MKDVTETTLGEHCTIQLHMHARREREREEEAYSGCPKVAKRFSQNFMSPIIFWLGSWKPPSLRQCVSQSFWRGIPY